MRLTWLLCLLSLLQLGVAPATSEPATTNCSAYLDGLAKDLETNTVTVDDFAGSGSPSADHIAQSAARYNRDASDSKLCPPAKRDFLVALLTTWRAWLEHTADAEPDATAKLAAQELERCAVSYRGTQESATCAKWARQVAKWREAWSSQP